MGSLFEPGFDLAEEYMRITYGKDLSKDELKQIADIEVMKQKVKELRVQIDGLGQLTKGLKPIKQRSGQPPVGGMFQTYHFNSDEIEETVKSLFLAKAWLGKVLGALGTESPYPKDGTRKTVEDIEPTADTAKNLTIIDRDGGWEEMSHIEKVDWLRQEIGKIADILNPYSRDKELIKGSWDNIGTEGISLMFNAHRHTAEARFWLGFELQRIKEENK